MSMTSIFMMIIAVGFYGIGFAYFCNKAFNGKENRQ
jgi:hypothetical protein